LTIGGEGKVAEIDGAYFGAMSDRKTWRLIGLTAGSPRTSLESARSSS